MNPGITIASVLITAGLAFYAGAQSEKGETQAALERGLECNRLLDAAYAERAQSALVAEGDRYCARCEVVSVRPEEAAAPDR